MLVCCCNGKPRLSPEHLAYQRQAVGVSMICSTLHWHTQYKAREAVRPMLEGLACMHLSRASSVLKVTKAQTQYFCLASSLWLLMVLCSCGQSHARHQRAAMQNVESAVCGLPYMHMHCCINRPCQQETKAFCKTVAGRGLIICCNSGNQGCSGLLLVGTSCCDWMLS